MKKLTSIHSTYLLRITAILFVVLLALLSTQPAQAQFTTVLNIPPDPDIGSLRTIGSDTQVNLSDGGSIDGVVNAGATDGSSSNIEVNITGGTVGRFFDAYNGSTVNISGGTVGDYFEVFNGSMVNITGGTVGNRFVAFEGSTVNISGGMIGDVFNAYSDSMVNISGGAVGNSFDANSGSTVNISSGTVGGAFHIYVGSTVNLSGGAVGRGFSARSGSTANLLGGEFRLDGELIAGLESVGASLDFDLPADSVLSGTLEDGTPFAFSMFTDKFAADTLTLHAMVLPAIGPASILASTDPVPLGIRQGQTLTVDTGGVVGDNFNAGRGSTVIVHAGGQRRLEPGSGQCHGEHHRRHCWPFL